MSYFQDDFVTLHVGDCREVMAAMEAESVSAIVTDPPYGLSFMGREWDHGVPGVEFWTAAIRVAKPGAHLVAFGGTRTFHRLAVAIEDAGWEIRDTLGWLYGSGFPKSLDVSKALDKAAGVEREREKCGGLGSANSFADDAWTQEHQGQRISDEPVTAAAAAWSGWGTALKPAWEPIILARKPLGMTVARCVQEHGTGALNIDGCRVEWASDTEAAEVNARTAPNSRRLPENSDGTTGWGSGRVRDRDDLTSPLGRWPANICHDGSEDVLAVFPQSTDGVASGKSRGFGSDGYVGGTGSDYNGPPIGYGGSGSAARFFYCAKATTAERDDGLHDAPDEYEHSGPRGHTSNGDGSPRPHPRRNTHPTVKPVALMRWLVRLVTPPGGTVLDPFMGSGTTCIAARAEGFASIGIDLEAAHVEIARGRMSQAVLL